MLGLFVMKTDVSEVAPLSVVGLLGVVGAGRLVSSFVARTLVSLIFNILFCEVARETTQARANICFDDDARAGDEKFMEIHD